MSVCHKPALSRPCVNHFSHNHPLRPIQVKDKEEFICSGCGLELSGSAYKCSKFDCDFFLHKSCFELEPILQHRSHPNHPLTLLPSPPKDYSLHRFACDACHDYGTGFVYHCAACKFDLHVGCASLPDTLEHFDHRQHPLTLFYSSSCNKGIKTFVCDVCQEIVPDKHFWVYYCSECDYGVHLRCVNSGCSAQEVSHCGCLEKESESESYYKLESVLEHESHPDHPLILLSSPPNNYTKKRFYCNSCGDYGIGFDYHCSACKFDLHIDCAFLPKTMKHVNHEHPLKLFYSSSCNKGITTFTCDECQKVVSKSRWVYYCEKCDYGTHIRCTVPTW